MEANKGAVKYFGYEREELIGQTPCFYRLREKMKMNLFNQIIEKAVNGEPQKFEWLGKLKNGEIRATETSFNKINYNGHDTVIAICSDLTESKKVVAGTDAS